MRSNLGTLRGLLPGDGLCKTHISIASHCDQIVTHLFFCHSGDDRDEEIFAIIESSLDLLAKRALRNFNIILRSTVVGHQVEETLIDVDLKVRAASFRNLTYGWKGEATYELVFFTPDVWNIHVVRGGANILLLT